MKDTPHVVPGMHWHLLDNGQLQCDLCPRFCKLHEGQRGLCFVRGRENDQMQLYTYGRSSGFCIDPIEKKPLNHFLPGTPVLSFGTAGCNLACKFCQNWDISKSREMDRLASQAQPEQIAHSAQQSGCKSVAFTYNDPVIFYEYALDVADACHAVDIKTVAVTAGYICEAPREKFFRKMDAANVDLKAFNDKFYYQICGAHLAPVLETLTYIKHETNCWMEITTLLIPGENDSNDEIEQMTSWIRENLGPEVPLHFTAFHPDWKMRDKQHTSLETLLNARDIALKNGLQYVYSGNVHHVLSQSTYCPNCGNTVIERDWYELGRWDLDVAGHALQGQGFPGHCHQCHASIAGVFDGRPGSWGAQRLPVRIT